MLCPWSLALASSIPVLGLESVYPRKAVLGLGLGFFCVLGLEPCVLDSTSAVNLANPDSSFCSPKDTFAV